MTLSLVKKDWLFHLRSFCIKKWINRYRNCKLIDFATFFSLSFLCAMAFVIGNANKMSLLLLFEIKALIDRIVGAWKLKLGKNITRHYLPKGLTMLFLNLSKWTTKKNGEISSYYFYAANKASESLVSSAVRMLLLSSGKFSLWLLSLNTNI